MAGDPKTSFAFLNEIWSNRWVKLIVLLFLVAVFVEILVVLWPVLKLLVVALILAYIFDPLVDRMQGRRMSRTAAVLLLIAGMAVLAAGFAALILPLIVESISNFVAELPRYFQSARAWIDPAIARLARGGMPKTLDGWIDKLQSHLGILKDVSGSLSSPVYNALKSTFSGLRGFIEGLLNIVIIPVAWFYLLRDIDPLKAWILNLFPERKRQTVRDHALEIDGVVSNFLRGQLTVAAILGVIYALGLQFVAGVPMGILIGLMAGALCIVPYLGLIVGIAPALILALLEHGDFLHPFLVVVVFAAAQALEGNFITPRIVGGKLGLHPVTVMFAILIWGSLLGLTGMLIAVPVTAVIQVFALKAVARYKAGDFYRRET